MTCSSSTFADSEGFGSIYLYTYVLVTIVIIGGAYQYASKVKLHFESYQLLHKIHKELGIITLAINALETKHSVDTTPEKLTKVIEINEVIVAEKIKKQFNVIRTMIDKHEKLLLDKVDMCTNAPVNINQNIEKKKDDRSCCFCDQSKITSDKSQMLEILSTQDEKQRQQEVEKNNVNQNENKTYEIVITTDTHDEKPHGNTTTLMVEEDTEIKIDTHMHIDQESTTASDHDNDTDNKNNSENQLDEYIQKKLDKLRPLSSLSTAKSFCKTFLKILWNFRSLLMPSVTHFFDTATDIALIIEWYGLYQCQKKSDSNYLSSINMSLLFYSSLSVLIYYRISSSVVIYRFTRNKFDAIFQFLFDYFLIKMIYYNLYKLRSFKAHSMINIVRGLEGSTESVFQSILSLVFIIKLYDINDESVDTIDGLALISFLFSLYSVISRFIVDDRFYLDKSAHNANIEFDDLCPISRFCSKLKDAKNWLSHGIFRAIDVATNVLVIALCWTQVSIMYFIVFALIIVFICYLFFGRGLSSMVQFIKYGVKQPIKQHKPYFIQWGCLHRQETCTSRFIGKIVKYRPMIRFVIIRWIFISIIYWKTHVDSSGNVLVWALITGTAVTSVLCPIFYLIFVAKLFQAKDRSLITHSFDVVGAIHNSNIDFLIFVRLLKVDIFAKYNKQAPKTFPFVCGLHDEYPHQWHNMLSTLVSREKIDWQFYKFMKNWYENPDKHKIDGNQTETISNRRNASDAYDGKFKRYLKNQFSNVNYKILLKYCRDISMYEMLHDSKDDENIFTKFKIIAFAPPLKLNAFAKEIGYGMHLCNVKKLPYSEWNGLHFACYYHENIEIIQWFVDREEPVFDINQQTSHRGWTALHLIMIRVKNSQLNIMSKDIKKTVEFQIVQLLKKKGISTTIKDKQGRTAQDIVGRSNFERLYNDLCQT